MLIVFLLPPWIAWTANGSPVDRISISLVFSATLSGILVFIKELLGGLAPATQSSTGQTASPANTKILIRSFPSKFWSFFSAFAMNTSGRLGSRGQYDPDPRRKSRKHKGHRKGVEPAGLKRWRLSHRRTADPGYASTHWRGPRGGHYFQGPHKKRYDPAPPRKYSRARNYVSRAGRGIEGALNKWGTALGFALGIGAGVYGGYTTYHAPATGYGANADANYVNTVIGGPIKDATGTVLATRVPEVSHLWATNDPGGYNTVPYLQYKFLGQKPDGTTPGSAWVIPFWASLITWIGTTIGMRIGRLGKLHRILRPLNKIAKGSTIATTIGALTLPGCGKEGPQGNPIPPPPPNTLSMMQDSPGHFVQAPVPMTKEFTYKG